MIIQELNPSRKYIVGLSSEFVTADDLQLVREQLDDLGVSSVVINDLKMTEIPRYFGIYCEQCNVWQARTNGDLHIYPTKEIANAHAHNSGDMRSSWHLWQAREFGTEIQVPQRPEGNCPEFLKSMGEVSKCS